MRIIPTLLSILISAAPVAAQTDYSSEIAKSGLTATERRLSMLAAPTDADRFALGGTRFLLGVEEVLQIRWQFGVTDQMQMIPLLRLPIDENPDPTPFDPATIATAFRGLSARMDDARMPLVEIPASSDFGVTIRLDDLWFDINANSRHDAGESMMDVAGPILLGGQWGEPESETRAPVIRFDGADAAWLSAYAHLLAGISDFILAYDPTSALSQVVSTKAALSDLRRTPLAESDLDEFSVALIDAVFTITRALDQTPDSARMNASHQHLLAMIADNREFWSRVSLETDDSMEWLPNSNQTSALGLDLPPETEAVWLGILAELESLLNGSILAPYWWLDDGAGINVARMFSEPAPIDLIGWIQGTDALPYVERGTLMTGNSAQQFIDLMGGQAMLLAFYLN
jgi:hypothetical protein